MHAITVFTPTYNRANTIVRTYESLCRQTCKDFEWLVVDDGSIDNTRQLVEKWISEGLISIRYIYKENGGLHTGYNVAIANITSELCMCCDSDDNLPDDAIEFIIKTWSQYGSANLAGIIGLDFIDGTNKPIGGYFSKDYVTCHFTELSSKLKHQGDTKMVIRTEVLKPHVPMRSFHDEKNFNPIYIFFKVNPDLDYLIVNHNLCNVDYQPFGMSANIYNQFINSPRSFAEIRIAKLQHPRISLSRKFIDAAHLVSSALIARDFRICAKSPKKILTFLASPFGMALYFYILYKTAHK